MNNKLEGSLYLLGAMIRLFDFSTDIWYVYSQEFQTDWLYYISVILVLGPSLIFFLLFTYLALVDLCKGNIRQYFLKTIFGFIISLFEPTGLILCGFGFLLMRKQSKKPDYYIAEGITRAAGFIEGIFKSLPQLIIQSYNNNENGNWDIFTITSVAFSAGGFLYTCFKLLRAIDMIKHYEDKEIQKQMSKIGATTADRVVSVENQDEFEEVYNSDRYE